MKFYLYVFSALLFFPCFAFAQSPSVGYFNASPSSVNSNQPISFTWSIVDGGGYLFHIPCIQGIKFFRTDGSGFNCNDSISSVVSVADGIDIAVRNLTGNLRSISARITPKDTSDNDAPSASRDISVAVAPVAKPIEELQGASSVISNQDYTLGWTASQLPGVNLQISCSSVVRTTSPSYTKGELPCNTPIFTDDLSPSRSITLNFTNNTTATSSITLTVLPAMETGIYNGAGAQSITVDVVPKIIPDPVTASFYTSPNTPLISENTPISLFWGTENSDGANLWFSCNDNITPILTIGNATSTPKCNTLAFETTLEASSTMSMVFLNKSFTTESITISIIPKSKKGGFDGTRGRQLTLSILAKGAVATTPVTQKISAPLLIVTTATTPTPTKVPLFTKYLSRGSKGSEVVALQTLMGKDPTVYPEGTTDGNFGPATQRAVRRLQIKYNVANATTPGYGVVGPKTRALLNSLNK